MAQIIEQQRINTVIEYQDTIKQRRHIARLTREIEKRVKELSRKPREQLTDTERGELRIAANFASELVEISNNHEFGRQYVEYSQRIRNVLQQQQQVCAETQTLTGELKCEMPAVAGVPSLRGTWDEEEDQQNADILQQPEGIDQIFYLAQLHGQIAQIKTLDTTLGDRLSTFFTSHNQELFLAEVETKIHTAEVSDADVLRITRESLLTAIQQQDIRLLSGIHHSLGNHPEWKDILLRFHLQSNYPTTDIEQLDIVTRQLQDILDHLRNGKISVSLVQEIVDSVKESPESSAQRHEALFLLGGIFSAFNRMGIKVYMQYNGTRRGIQLMSPDNSSEHHATRAETQQFQNSIDQLQENLSPGDIQRIFLYRTTRSLNAYLSPSPSPEVQNTDAYVFSILGAQGIREIRAQVDSPGYDEEARTQLTRLEQEGKGSTREYLQIALGALEPDGFTAILDILDAKIEKSQVDKEFLRVYFQDIYYNKRILSGEEYYMLNDYKNFIIPYQDQIQHLFTQLNTLDEKTSMQLGLATPMNFERWGKTLLENPIQGIMYGLTSPVGQDMMMFGVVAAVLGKLFGFKLGKSFMVGAAATGLAHGGSALYNSEIASTAGNMLSEFFSPGSQESTAVDPQIIAMRTRLSYDVQVKPQHHALWMSLTYNPQFLNHDAKILHLFQSDNTITLPGNSQITYLHDALGIPEEEIEPMRQIFEEVFRDLDSERMQSVGAPKQPETMREYLLRSVQTSPSNASSNTGTTSTATGSGNHASGPTPQPPNNRPPNPFSP